MKLMAMLLCAGVLAGGPMLPEGAAAADSGEITCFPTYGHQEGDHWLIPMRVWAHEPRALLDGWITAVAASMGDLNAQEKETFRSRIRWFLADSESREAVVIRFEGDPDNREYRIQDGRGQFPRTDLNGVIAGTIEITAAQVKRLLRRPGARPGWLTYGATAKGMSGSGQVQLIPPAGLSVISDIDDTIKVTEIPAGTRVVIENTFFRPFVAAPGMAKLYRGWADKGAAFHYVSGGPWQMYRPLADFLFSAPVGFPEGSFAMKSVSFNPLSARTWEALADLVGNENATLDQKVDQISRIMRDFPHRRFILVGDSGESDPEVYRRIADAFPRQVQEVRIRDVINDRVNRPDRLKRMTVIAADTVRPPPSPGRPD